MHALPARNTIGLRKKLRSRSRTRPAVFRRCIIYAAVCKSTSTHERNEKNEGEGWREEGGELFHNDDSRLSLLAHVVRSKKATLTGAQRCAFYFVPACVGRARRVCIARLPRWMGFFETFRRFDTRSRRGEGKDGWP